MRDIVKSDRLQRLFTLRIPGQFPSEGMIIIHAFEVGWIEPNHTRIDVIVKQNGKVIFPRAFLYCGIPSSHSIDGFFAKEAVLSLVAMKPGDTDADYFNDYKPEQLEWVEHNGEYLSIVRWLRYCDDDGNLKEK